MEKKSTGHGHALVHVPFLLIQQLLIVLLLSSLVREEVIAGRGWHVGNTWIGRVVFLLTAVVTENELVMRSWWLQLWQEVLTGDVYLWELLGLEIG